MATGTTVCVRDDGGVARKITKVIPYADGGFALAAPYHEARRGHLMKVPIDYTKQRLLVDRAEIVDYTAEDRVKLSYHPDGFVQFSGEAAGRIVSGRDPATGEPRGVGVITNPMHLPMMTGPNCGVQAFGIESFASADAAKPHVMIFEPADYYYRHCTPESARAFNLEFFIFTPHFLPHIRVVDGKGTLPLWHNGFEGHGAMFDFRVITLDRQSPFFLGALAWRAPWESEVESGFVLNGPGEWNDSNIKRVIMAMYPNIYDLDDARPLDYTPE